MPWYSITLRVIGDTLDPDAISIALKQSPTQCHRKGDNVFRPDGSKVWPARSGRWSLKFTPESLSFEDCCDAVEHILTLLNDDLEAWRSVTNVHRADFFIGLNLDTNGRGIELSPKLMLLLGERGIRIGFDVYSKRTDEEATTSDI